MFTRRPFLSYSIIITIFLVFSSLHHPAAASPGGGSGDGGIKAKQLMAGLPLYFEANRGQISEKLDYLARAGNLRAYIGPAGAVMSLRGAAKPGLFRGW